MIHNRRNSSTVERSVGLVFSDFLEGEGLEQLGGRGGAGGTYFGVGIGTGSDEEKSVLGERHRVHRKTKK